MGPRVKDSGGTKGARELLILGVTGIDVNFEAAFMLVTLVTGLTAKTSFLGMTDLMSPQVGNGIEPRLTLGVTAHVGFVQVMGVLYVGLESKLGGEPLE